MRRTKKAKRTPPAISKAASKEAPKQLGAPHTITRNKAGTTNKRLNAPTAARNLEFGKRLRAAMLAKGIRQIRMAELLEIGRDSMSTYANGKNIPHGARLEKMCEILGVKADDLVPSYGSVIQKVSPYTTERLPDGSLLLNINEKLVVKVASFQELSDILLKLGLEK